MKVLFKRGEAWESWVYVNWRVWAKARLLHA